MARDDDRRRTRDRDDDSLVEIVRLRGREARDFLTELVGGDSYDPDDDDGRDDRGRDDRDDDDRERGKGGKGDDRGRRDDRDDPPARPRRRSYWS